MQALEKTALHPLTIWERFVDDIYSVSKCRHLENIFHLIKILHQIKFNVEEESNGELAVLVNRESSITTNKDDLTN